MKGEYAFSNIGIAMLCAAAIYLGSLLVMRLKREGGRK